MTENLLMKSLKCKKNSQNLGVIYVTIVYEYYLFKEKKKVKCIIILLILILRI